MSQLWDELSALMTDDRRAKLLKIAASRSDQIRIVLEDVGKRHNISACLRTAEAFGVQHVHILSQKTSFDPSSVTRGVEKWLSIHLHQDVEDLRQAIPDYLIAVAYPVAEGCVSIDKLPVQQKLALVFGNEAEGVSPLWHRYQRFHVPMVGIVESLNISVCCAVSIAVLQRRMQAEGTFQYLPQNEQIKLLESWAGEQFPRAAQALVVAVDS
jgi:tRNA (guanosine-2'-O-)-methyltransferase